MILEVVLAFAPAHAEFRDSLFCVRGPVWVVDLRHWRREGDKLYFGANQSRGRLLHAKRSSDAAAVLAISRFRPLRLVLSVFADVREVELPSTSDYRTVQGS